MWKREREVMMVAPEMRPIVDEVWWNFLWRWREMREMADCMLFSVC